MRVFGNLTNRIAETVIPAVPVVGMGATILYYSDRAACTVIGILQCTRQSNPTIIRVQRDKATRTDKNGASESQTYAYEPCAGGEIFEFSKRKNGAWVKVGEAMKGGTILRVGERDEYYDFGF